MTQPQWSIAFLKNETFFSAIGAAISMSLTNPFNLIRFRMQTMPDLILQNQLKSPYKSPIDCLKRVYRQQGFKAFWKGNFSNIIRFYPAQVLTFYLKDLLNKKLSKIFLNPKTQSFKINTVSGIISGCITLTLLYPLQFARLKLINNVKGENKSIYNVIKQTIKVDGVKAIFRGSMISYFGMAVFRGLYFGLYDSYKSVVNNNLQKFFVSYISTVIALLGIYPFDTIRRRLMMTSGQNYKYGSSIKFIQQIYMNEGLKGFFPGVSIIFFEAFTIGIMFGLFDNIFCKIKHEN